MKLGRDTNSVNNWLMSGTNGQPAPAVGMGVTVLMWTDRHAGTITRVSPSGKTFWFTLDTATRTDDNGMSECQSYTFTSNPDAQEHRAYQTKAGAWKSVRGQLRLDDRSEYHDYSF